MSHMSHMKGYERGKYNLKFGWKDLIEGCWKQLENMSHTWSEMPMSCLQPQGQHWKYVAEDPESWENEASIKEQPNEIFDCWFQFIFATSLLRKSFF